MANQNEVEMVPCIHEKDFGEIHAKLRTLDHIVPELNKTVIKLDTTMTIFSKNTEDLTKVIRGVLKSQDESIGEEKGVEKFKNNQRWVVGFLVTAVIALAGVILKLISVINELKS